MIIIFHNLLLMFFPSQCNDAYYNSWLEQINFQCSFQVNVMNNDGDPYNCLGSIVAKKRDPGILDPELFLAQIRKVEARLGKLAKIRKSVIN